MRRLFACSTCLGAVLPLPALAAIPQVKHIIIITQENRSTDSLFHGLNAYLPGVDVADTGMTSTGQIVPLQPILLTAPWDMSHAYIQFRTQYANGQMNGNDQVTCTPATGTTCPPLPGYVYVQQSEVQPLFDMATQYGFANRMFQTNRGPSLPAHLQLLSGSGEPIANSNIDAANNYNSSDAGHTISGCAAPPTSTLQLVGAAGQVVQNVFPCFEHMTMPDLLDHAGGKSGAPISWRYYTNSLSGILDAPNAIRHLCQPKTVGGVTTCAGPRFSDGHIVPNSPQVLRDIMAGNLQAVTWVNPPTISSDHPLECNDSGPSWVSAIVNTIGQSAYWNNTVIFVTWDDWGGFYDHVAPPNDPVRGYYEYGFRVPLLVISPFTPAGTVSNVTHDFGSILHFIETVFGLPFLAPGNFADSRSDNLTDFFNFSAAPRSFTPIAAPYPISYFLDMAARQAAHPGTILPDPD